MRRSGQIATGLDPSFAASLRRAKLLPRSFFARDPVTVSRELLGKIILRSDPAATLAGRIVETEAYLGAEDPAAHAYRGPTDRNRVLFGPAGHAYVYFIYGMYYCLNFSCMKTGEAGCTLIRALEPLAGLDEMARHRYGGRASRTSAATHTAAHELTPAAVRNLCSGPGKLCTALAITRAHDNDKDVCSRSSDLQVLDDGYTVARISASPRVGISKAADLPLRFFVAGSPFLSRR